MAKPQQSINTGDILKTEQSLNDVNQFENCEMTDPVLGEGVTLASLADDLAMIAPAAGKEEIQADAAENTEEAESEQLALLQFGGEEADVVPEPSPQQLESMADKVQAELKENQAEEQAEAEPSVNTIRDLAQIEPAAGGAQAGAGGASGGGYGFQSDFSAQGVIGIEDVGPINPTELQYNLPEFQERYFVEEEPLPNLNPSFEMADGQVYEDGSVALPLIAAPESANGDLTIVISGIPTGWGVSLDVPTSGGGVATGVFDPIAGTWTLTLTGGEGITDGPVFTPPADSDVDALDLQLSLSEVDTATGQTGSASGEFDVIVDAVADDPSIVADDDSGVEGATLSVDLSALTGEEVNNGAGSDDGSESIVKYQISGIPAGFTVSAGTDLGGGVWEFTPAEIVGLTITPNDSNFFGSINLTATVFTEESITDTDFDNTNDTNNASDPFTLTWTPVIHPPSINVNNGVDNAIVKEDGSVDVPITAALGDNPAAGEYLTVVVEGIDPNWGFSAPVGTYDSAAGTWTVVLAPGESLDAVMTFTPPADSDIDLSGLTATATATDPAAGISADSAPDGFNIIVDAVYDDATVDGIDNAGAKNVALDVDISGAAGDTDGSETVVKYQVSDVPDGFTFNNGSNLGGGVWEFTPAELAGLEVTPPTDYVGSIDLTVTIFTTENPVDAEVDPSDNTTTANDVFTLTWKPIALPPEVCVNNGVDNAIVKEDNSVDVPITATLSPEGSGNEVLTVVVTGIDPTWGFSAPVGTYDSAAGTWTVTLAPGENLNTVFTFTPPADSDIDLSGLQATASAYEPATGTSANATPDDFGIIVDAVADDPSIVADDDSGVEGTPLDVDLSALTGEEVNNGAGSDDGSESIVKYQISGVPDGFTVSAGTDLGGGVWEFTPAEIVGLTITPNDPNFSGSIDLTATVFTQENTTDGEVDTSDNTNSASDPFTLTWTPGINPPCINVNNGVDDVIVKEDGSVDVPITAELGANPAAGEYLTVEVEGVDPSWGFSAPIGNYNPATGVWTITLAPGASLNTLLTFTPPADSDIDLNGLTATAYATDPDAGLSADSGPDGFNIIVDAVADDPSIVADDDSGVEGTPLDVDLSALTGEEVNNGAGSDDGSESIVKYQISGVPDGFTVSAGTDLGGGVWEFTPAEIVGLTITPNDPNFSGSIDLTATVFTQENTTDGEVDTSDNTNSASDPFTLTWTPGINPPCINVNNGVDDVIVKEDGSVDVPITAELGANPAAGEYLTVEVEGVDPSWGFSAPIGNYNPATGVWTITLAPGASLNTLLTFTPPADSDIDLNGLTATAYATDPDAGLSADSGPDGFNIIVDAVADVPNLDAQNTASGEEGSTIPLTITTSVNDTDGSEVIEVVKITGVPSGVTLNVGTYDAVTDTWSIDPADLGSVALIVPDGYTGDFNITVESVAYEQNTSGTEVDLTDNRASAFDTISVSISPDTDPVVCSVIVNVDETNMAPTTGVGGTIISEFGPDAPGVIYANGTSSIGTITSGGQVVVVEFDAATNTYTGVAGGETIFTMVIESDGDYNFTLIGTLDHPDTTDPDDSLPLVFGISGEDSDGDIANATITVNVKDDGPVAEDDCVEMNYEDSFVIGNVMDNDDLSKDMDNHVTKIKFEGDVVDVPQDGSDVVIHGDFGTLTINNLGEYKYEPVGGIFGDVTKSLNPTSADVAGIQESFTKNGITIELANSGDFDISWVNTADGSGLGIDNRNSGDSTKVWPTGETFDISFERDASAVTLTIAELGSNNNYGQHGLDYIVTLADGSVVAGEQQFVPSGIVDGHFTFTLDASDFGGQLITSIEINSTNAGSYKGASFLLNDVSVDYDGAECVQDIFEYVLTDSDGDSDPAILKIKTHEPEDTFIVGNNVDDDASSSVPHLVNGDEGVIVGSAGQDILVGDAGGSFLVEQTQDYNFVFILDVSGSMGSTGSASSRITLLYNAMKSLMDDVATYDGGDIKVHIVPFADAAKTTGTFTVTDAGQLDALKDYLDNISTGGFTNYEDPMQAAIDWLEGSEPLGGSAITTTYFISDGQPNRYMNDAGAVTSGNSSTSIGQVTGSDGTNEVLALQTLSDDLIAVGLNLGSSSLSILDQIDTGGDALNISDADDLTVALADTNPLNKLLDAGDDVIEGGRGDDIIFGDVLFTDDLADAQGLTDLRDGSGWDVFARLENGEGSDASWDRDDTIEYIRTHQEEMAGETLDDNGLGRAGGDDVLNGGEGDDIIFGQEGNDLITGGLGDDILYGGSGADTFIFNAINEGVDTIKDFDVSEGDLIDLSAILTGYDSLTDDIADFVIATEDSGNTILSVDQTGAGNAAGATQFAVLEGVTGLDLDTSIKTDTFV